MKKLHILIVTGLFLFGTSCQKDDLNLVNPNDPSLGSLSTEDGLKAYALGLLEKAVGDRNSLAISPFIIAVGHHNIMGDDMYTPWGNWGWRWSALYNTIKINATGDVYQHTLYPGESQKEFMQANNSRAAGDVNSFKYEWYAAYQTIGQCNALLAALDKTVSFSGDAEVKQNTLKAWAYWWKGFMYSRIGSIYLGGLIVDEFGATNGNYIDRTLIIDEATSNFDKAAALLVNISSGNADYEGIMKAIIASFNNNTAVVQPDMWIRAINSYKARNILVNKKISEMETSDWDAIAALAQKGLQSTDNVFTLGMTADGKNDFVEGFYHPYWLDNSANGWWFVSERLIQEYLPGDKRLDKAFSLLETPEVNKRNRGWNFGTRYQFVDIEEGGLFATAQGKGQWPLGPTYEENELMLAEAKLRKGDLTGLEHVDNVRSFQGAGLSAVNGTSLTLDEALEQFRKERRAALALRGLSFYDARRWGVTAPLSAGGGRSDAMIVIPSNIYDPDGDGAPDAYSCTIDYNYMDYWDLPADELDFNEPLEGSVSVHN
ncbi:MAG TPA: RagB/SusD family nutrient uptake outer membrane protein [Ohtaekwangia sp.]|uniref:RagB/SusD family nutrient uptake outer membrane protein n=1 Tax=Ohtaekwangia sp. TaxID=2066019 RepID=UPI002F93545B